MAVPPAEELRRYLEGLKPGELREMMLREQREQGGFIRGLFRMVPRRGVSGGSEGGKEESPRSAARCLTRPLS